MENGPGNDTKVPSKQEEPVISLRPGGFGFGFGIGFKSAQAPTDKSKQRQPDVEPLLPSLLPKPESIITYAAVPKLSQPTELDIETPDPFQTIEGKQIYNRKFLFQFQDNVDLPEGLDSILQGYPELQVSTIVDRSFQNPKEYVARQLRTTKPATGGAPIEKGTHPQSSLPRRAANRWEPRPSFIKDERFEVLKAVTGTLNKITPEKFDKLSTKLCIVIGAISDEDIYTEAVGLVFAKAVQEPNFSKMYAELCVRLNLQPVPLLNSKVTFKRVLLNKCQQEFESTYQAVAKNNATNPEDRLILREKARSRKLGNVKFIGELFKSRLVSEKIIHECIRILLNSISIEKGDQEIIENHCELLCKLMTTIGKLIDIPKAKEDMASYFTRFQQMSQDTRFSSRLRFMILDLLDLRLNNWVPRREENTPKTFGEVQADAIAKEFQDIYSLTEPHRTPSTTANDPAKKEKKKIKKKKKPTKESTKKLTESELETKATLLLRDYLESGDIQEAIQAIKELAGSQYSSKIIEKAILLALERNGEIDAMRNLFVALSNEVVISEEDFMKGFKLVIDSLEDIELDIPQAAELVGKLLGHATVGNCISLSLAERVKEDRVKKSMMEVIQSSR